MSDDRPTLRIVRGEPTAEELAIIAALVSAAGGDDEQPTPPIQGRWNDPVHGLRRPMRPGFGAWQASVR